MRPAGKDQGPLQSHYLDSFLGELKRSMHLELVKRWGGIPKTGRVLKTDLFEESGGPDAWIDRLSSPQTVTIGIDISPIIAARAMRADSNRAARYVVADIRNLPFKDASFDLVVSPSTLDHFEKQSDISASLHELARIIARSGRLIVTVDNRQNVFHPLLRLASRLHLTPFFLGHSYNVGELREALASAGFHVEDTTAILQNPRLTAVGAVNFAKLVGWPPLMRLVQRTILRAQRLENTGLRYHLGSFVAAKAVRRV